MHSNRKPWLAAILGLLYPGLGHLYAGASRTALGLMVSVPFALVPVLTAAAIYLPRPLNILGLWGGLAAVLGVGAIGGARAARNSPVPFQLGRFNRWWVYAACLLLNAYVLLPSSQAVAKRFIGEAFRIPASSMEPTVRKGDYFYIARNSAPPRAGELVVFRSVEESTLLVLKRAVAVSGDTVEMRADRLLRNGVPVDEPYAVSTDPTAEADPSAVTQMAAWQTPLLAGDTTGYRPSLRTWGPLVVPTSTFIALGDNRDGSYDSRFYGPVPASHVLGRPGPIYLSYDLDSQSLFAALTTLRWRRLGLTPR